MERHLFIALALALAALPLGLAQEGSATGNATGTVAVDQATLRVRLVGGVVERTLSVQLANHLSEDLGTVNVTLSAVDLVREANGTRESLVPVRSWSLPFGPYQRHEVAHATRSNASFMNAEGVPYALELGGERFDDFAPVVLLFESDDPRVLVTPSANCSRRICFAREKLPVGRTLVAWALEAPRLSLERSLPAQAVAGEPFEVNLTVTNLGEHPLRVRLDEPANPRIQYLSGALALVHVPGRGDLYSVNTTLGPSERRTLSYLARIPVLPALKSVVADEPVMVVELDGTAYRGRQQSVEVLRPTRRERNVTLRLLSDASAHGVLRSRTVEDLKAHGSTEVLRGNMQGVVSLVEWRVENATGPALLAPFNGTVEGSEHRVEPVRGDLVVEQNVTFTVRRAMARGSRNGTWDLLLPESGPWVELSLPEGMSFRNGTTFAGPLAEAPRRAYELSCGDGTCLPLEQGRCCADCGCLRGFACLEGACVPQPCEGLGILGGGLVNDNVRQGDGECRPEVSRPRQRALFLALLALALGAAMWASVRYRLVERARRFVWKRVMREWVGL